MDAHDVWRKLWDLATSEPGEPAQIQVFDDEPGRVVLHWSDGSCSQWCWHAGAWQQEG